MNLDNEQLRSTTELSSTRNANRVVDYTNLKKRVDDLVSIIAWRNEGVDRVVDAVEELQQEALPDLYKHVDDLIEKLKKG